MKTLLKSAHVPLVAAIAAVLGFSCATADAADPVRRGSPVPQTSPVKKGPAPLTFVPMGTKTLSYVPFAVVPGNMDGWIALTTGASKGGASLVNGTAYPAIVTRGADDDLYIATFDPANPGLIDSKSWFNAGVKSTSEPTCAGVYYEWHGEKERHAYCLFLGSKGNAEFVDFKVTTSGFQSLHHRDLGGSAAGAAPIMLSHPTVEATEEAGYKGGYGAFRLGVWDGSAGLWTKQDGWRISKDGYAGSLEATAWTKLSVPFFTPPACDMLGSMCAVASLDGAVRILRFKLDGAVPDFGMVSPVLAEGISGKPAVTVVGESKLAVVVRGKSGKVFQIIYNTETKAFGTWKDEGGYVAAGTSPACTWADNTALCVIQGNDGRLYAKSLSTPSGL